MPRKTTSTLCVRSLRSLPLPLSLWSVLGDSRFARISCAPSSSVRESKGFRWGIGGLSPATISLLLRRSTPPYSRSLTLAPTAPFRSSFLHPPDNQEMPSLDPQAGGDTPLRGKLATLVPPQLRYPRPPADQGRPYGARDSGCRQPSAGSHYFSASAPNIHPLLSVGGWRYPPTECLPPLPTVARHGGRHVGYYSHR